MNTIEVLLLIAAILLLIKPVACACSSKKPSVRQKPIEDLMREERMKWRKQP